MKKIVSVLLAGALMLSMTACANTVPANVTGSVVEKNAVEETSKDSSTVSIEKDDNSVTASTEENNSAVAENNTSAAEDSFSVGEVVSDVYENDFFNVKVSLIDGFRFLTEDEISSLGQATVEQLSETAENISKALEDGSVVAPMYVTDTTGLNSLGLNVSYLGIAGAFVTEAAIIDASLEQVIQILTDTGYTDVTAERTTTTFLGKEVDCMVVHGTISGVSIYEKQVEIIKDGYMASFTATSFLEDTTDDIIAMVSSLN